MQRREFLTLISGGALLLTGVPLAGCGATAPGGTSQDEKFVIMYDTYAQSLYMDGTLGPKTGILRVEDIIKGKPVRLDFWHGHGGVSHRYIVTPQHFELLKAGKRVVIETDQVDGHSHKLFIDPVLPQWRVPGAPPVKVPLAPTEPETPPEPLDPVDPEDPVES